MTQRRCTIINGTINQTGTLAVELVLSGDMALRLDRRSLWIPRQSIEGGSSIRTGDTDPAISNWWLRQRGIFDLVTQPAQRFSSPTDLNLTTRGHHD